jgi:hypothetical protein
MKRAAAMYSILQTAKLNGVNPQAYLTNTLARIADGHPINRISELMPWAYQPPLAQIAASSPDHGQNRTLTDNRPEGPVHIVEKRRVPLRSTGQKKGAGYPAVLCRRNASSCPISVIPHSRREVQKGACQGLSRSG